ncbi:MAG: O-antigen translocase [Thermaurantimonas sp.]
MTEQISEIKAQADKDRSSYRQIMKATSIFGGVQVFQIIIGIIRTKFVAVLLGPAGMGIAGLLDSTTGLIAQLSNLGLRTSAVKDISVAYGSDDQKRTAKIAAVINRLVWFTGLLGALITLVLAPLLSQLTFGNREYTWAFMWLSVTLLFNQLSVGKSILLQGTRQIRYLARAGVIGSLMGLFVTVPFYYFLGIRGIVPGMILMSIFGYIVYLYFANKVQIMPVTVSVREILNEGRNMIQLGFLISLNGLITMGVSYAVRIYISRTGGVEDVGLFNAGFAMINTYVGLLFSAMGTDYYPRLSSVASDNERSRNVINQQAEIALLILSPLIMTFLVFINWAVIMLYSYRFLPISDMMLYAALGMFFKAASWAIAFIFLAQGANKLFFWSELATNLYTLALNVLGYHFLGLTGLGISFLVAYGLYLTQVFWIARVRYSFRFTSAFYQIFGLHTTFAVVCLAVVKWIEKPYSYVLGLVLISVSSFYAYKELDKRIDIKSLIVSIKNRI